MTQTTDILVIGGGLSGLTFAKALENSRLSVMLCEQNQDPRLRQSGHLLNNRHPDQRAIALSLESQKALEDLGVWPLIAPDSTPILKVHVSSQGQFGACRVNAKQEGLDSLGVVIPIDQLSQGLRNALTENSSLKLNFNTQLLSFEFLEDTAGLCSGVSCTLSQEGKTFKVDTKLLIAADGLKSPIRTQLGISTFQENYHQIAWVMQARIKQPHHHIAYERFTPEGPLAILPRSNLLESGNTGQDSGHWVSLTWVRKDSHPPLDTLSDQTRCALLQEAFGYRLGKFLSTHDPMGYPLVLTQAKRLFEQRVLLMGNAAHHIHPVAGQGFNLTLRDVRVLAQLLKTTQDNGQETQSSSERLSLCALHNIFNIYAHHQSQDQTRTVKITDQLVKLFGSQFLPTQIFRALALNLIERHPLLLTKLNNQLMGLTASGIHHQR